MQIYCKLSENVHNNNGKISVIVQLITLKL